MSFILHDWTKRQKRYTKKVFMTKDKIVGHCTCDVNFYLGCGCPQIDEQNIMAVYRVFKASHEKSNESWWAGEEVLVIKENEFGKQYIAIYGYKNGVLDEYKKEKGDSWKEDVCKKIDDYFNENFLGWSR